MNPVPCISIRNGKFMEVIVLNTIHDQLYNCMCLFHKTEIEMLDDKTSVNAPLPPSPPPSLNLAKTPEHKIYSVVF